MIKIHKSIWEKSDRFTIFVSSPRVHLVHGQTADLGHISFDGKYFYVSPAPPKSPGSARLTSVRMFRQCGFNDVAILKADLKRWVAI